jgi:hypothetical protein
MRIHVYVHPKGNLWAIDGAATQVIHGNKKRGFITYGKLMVLQTRTLIESGKLVQHCAGKLKVGYQKIGEITVPDNVVEALRIYLWVLREVLYRGADSEALKQLEPHHAVLLPAIHQEIATMHDGVNELFQTQDIRDRVKTASNASTWWLTNNHQTVNLIPAVAFGRATGCFF